MKNRRINSISSFFKAASLVALATVAWVHLGASSTFAAFGEDVEKPKPEFTREGSVINAKLLPRGKSNKITIGFEVKGGELKDVNAMGVPTAQGGDIDTKDFRSDLFIISVAGVSKGGDVTVTMRSDYFSSDTRFFVFNEKGNPAWNDVQAQNTIVSGKIRTLAITVKDGGNLDADGAANGKILLNAGPKDSFWGYAIGTLFIRFFGVFLVLGVLQIGMMICGKIFETAGKRKEELNEQALAQIPPVKSVNTKKMNSEMVAAVSVALHMALASGDAVRKEKLEDAEAQIDPDVVAAVSMVLHLERQQVK